jgi:type II secretory pathway pseudopilin PulG
MKTALKILAAVFLAWLAMACFFPANSSRLGSSRKAEAQNDVTLIVNALQAFKTQYGRIPDGDTAAVIAALRGRNPKEIVFLEVDDRHLSEDGLILDPWCSPYRVGVSKDGTPWAYSFGPAKIDEGGSDRNVASW